MIKDMMKTQTQLMAKVDHLARFTGASGGSCELPDEVRFPIKSLQELDTFELQMKDSQLKQLVVSENKLFVKMS
jgi:hypothetical protein